MDVRSLRFTAFVFLSLSLGCDPMVVDEPDAFVRIRVDAFRASDANLDAPGLDTAVTDAYVGDAGPCAIASDCDDRVFCNGVEACVDNRCQRGTAPSCDDMIACTIDVCDRALDACSAAAPDRDADGHRDARCLDRTGSPLGDDCDDTDARRAPGNLEVCDVLGVDEDCDLSTLGGIDMDRDTFIDSRCCNPMLPGATTRNCGLDCVDSSASVNPMGTETCNGIDDNCDGTPDEICICRPGLTRGCVLRGVCAAGVETCTDGTVWSACSIAPVRDVCNGRDEDCDGRVDEDTTVRCWLDVDGDGFADRDRMAENICPDIASGCPVNYTDVDPAIRRDCCDTDPRAFQGQTGYFDTISFCSDVGYNFDCDEAGTETPRWTAWVNDSMQDLAHEPECLVAQSAGACAAESLYQRGNPEWLSSELPVCGQGGNLVNSCTWVFVALFNRDVCLFAPAGQRQPCR